MKTLLLAALLAASASTLASAQTIYNDTFGRTGDLNGSSPAPVDSTGLTWLVGFEGNGGSGSFSTDGSELNVTANSGALGTATLGLTIAANTTYTASLTVSSVTNSVDPTQWLAFGFTGTNASLPSDGAFYAGPGSGSNPVNAQLWAIYRANGGTFTAADGVGTNGPTTDGGADTFTLTLNTGTGAYSITDSLAGLDQTGVLPAASVSAITGFGIGIYNSDLSDGTTSTTSGSVSNLTITEGTVPEPSSVALILTGFVGLVAVSRFRKVMV